MSVNLQYQLFHSGCSAPGGKGLRINIEFVSFKRLKATNRKSIDFVLPSTIFNRYWLNVHNISFLWVFKGVGAVLDAGLSQQSSRNTTGSRPAARK